MTLHLSQIGFTDARTFIKILSFLHFSLVLYRLCMGRFTLGWGQNDRNRQMGIVCPSVEKSLQSTTLPFFQIKCKWIFHNISARCVCSHPLCLLRGASLRMHSIRRDRAGALCACSHNRTPLSFAQVVRYARIHFIYCAVRLSGCAASVEIALARYVPARITVLP